MIEKLIQTISLFLKQNIGQYINDLQQYPVKLVSLIIDLVIVIYIVYKFIKATRGSRVWQLIKGIILLMVITAATDFFNLSILNFILKTIMTWGWGVVALVVIFQPEIRLALEKLGTNKITKLFGIDKSLATKWKEDIYKVTIAATELSKKKIGALIVFERDIRINNIIKNGIEINAEVSPQLLVNIFIPNTPLHDGATIISNNRIISSACILPLADDANISKELGTRHRAAIGLSKESDAIIVVVSEETGKISVARAGKLSIDVKEENLKKMLIKNLITDREKEMLKNKNIKNKTDKI
ncbi:MAG: diadenylate cyclase CdaA [Clostridia bacterium]|nr:diadenylate cyclase CdaA [Clostridia bacterium]